MVFFTNTNRYKKLVASAKEGDEEAFRQLFDLTHQKLFAFAVVRSKSREDAIDLVDETFIDLWRALTDFTYRSDREFMGFIFLILKRKLAVYYQKLNETEELKDNVVDSKSVIVKDEYGLHDLLGKLRLEYAEVLELRYWSGLQFDEIAATMGEKSATVRTWHRRALKELDNLLQKYE